MTKQNGAAAILALILLILAAVTMLTNQADLLYNLKRTRNMQKRMDLQQAALCLQGWMKINRNLPCPDTDQDGWLDDCTNKEKNSGWLPWKSLNLVKLKTGTILYQSRTHGDGQIAELWTSNGRYSTKLEFNFE